MSTTSTNPLEQKLLAFFKDMASVKENDNFDAERESFVFHMTDWQDELVELQRLFSRPDELSQAEADRILQQLFYHVLPHLNAAVEIYDDAVDIYKMHNKRKHDA